MSSELGIIVGFLGSAYIILDLAFRRGSTDSEDGPDGLRLFFIGVSWMFLLGGIFAIQQIAGATGYESIQEITYWLLRGGLLLYALVGAIILWDFIKKALDMMGVQNMDDWGGL